MSGAISLSNPGIGSSVIGNEDNDDDVDEDLLLPPVIVTGDDDNDWIGLIVLSGEIGSLIT